MRIPLYNAFHITILSKIYIMCAHLNPIRMQVSVGGDIIISI